MTGLPETIVHGTAIAIGDWAVLLRGPSGAGKSDLALRLMTKGAELISDDQVALFCGEQFVTAMPPPTIAGLLEVRGIGIVKQNYRPAAPLGLVIDLVAPKDVPRMPDAQTVDLLGFDLPLLQLAAFESSTPAKIKLALASLID